MADSMYQPPHGADGESQPDNSASLDDASAAKSTADDGPPERPILGDVAGQQGTGRPLHWRAFQEMSDEQLEHELDSLRILAGRHDYAGWVALVQQFPRVRALKERCGGKLFETRVKALCRISKSNAHAIIHEGLGEPPRIDEIWERTHAELHSADATEKPYRLPTINKMIGWYKKPDPDADKDSDADDDDEAEQGANDHRSAQALRVELLRKEDDARKLVIRAERAEHERDRHWDELGREQQAHQEAANSLAILREDFVRLKSERDAAQAERDAAQAERDAAQAERGAEIARLIEERDAEIARLTALVPNNDNENNKKREPQRKYTIADMTRTDIDPRWGAKKRIGGSLMPDFAHVSAMRIASYALLDFEPEVIAQAAAEVLNARKITFFRQVQQDMALETITGLPEKPSKE